MPPPAGSPRLLRRLLERTIGGSEAEHIRLDLEELYDRDRERGVSMHRALWRLTTRTLQSAHWLRQSRRGTEAGTPGLMSRLVTGATHDIADAVRSATRVPTVSMAIIGTLAVGLTLMAAAFSAYSAAFLQYDDVPEPQALFEVRRPPSPRAQRTWMVTTRPTLEAMRVDNMEIASMAGLMRNVPARSAGRPVNGALVTGTFFSVLGTSAHRGRTISDDDDRVGAPNAVVVLSHAGWRRLFQQEERAIGGILIINGVACHVIGVMPPNFRGLGTMAPDFWAPLGLLGALRPTEQGKEDAASLTVLARLNDHVSATEAQTRLTAWAQSRADLPASEGQPKTVLLLPHGGASPAAALEGLPWFAPLFVTFGLILLIGASNVSNLYMARGFSRLRELSIRSALGASRRRLVFLLTVDAFVLALAASVIAFVTAEWLVNVGLQGALTRLLPDGANVRPFIAAPADWRLMLMLLGCSVVVTMVAALGPALRVTREVSAGRASTTGPLVRPAGRRRFLIAVQVASSVVLVVVTSLLLQGAQRAADSETVIRVEDTLFVDAPQPSTRQAVFAAITSTPGVLTVAGAWPFGFEGENATATGAVQAPVDYRFVSPGYFQVLDVPLRKGRFFTDAEGTGASAMAIVNERTAQALWPGGEDPVGREIALKSWHRPGTARRHGAPEPPGMATTAYTVVGVVETVTVGTGASRQNDAGVYLPASVTSAGMSFVLRANGDPDAARLALFEQLERVDPSINAITTVGQIADRTQTYLEAVATLIASVGAIALLLMAGGLAAVMSYLVTHRRQEIGIRLALGATPADIASSVYAPLARPLAIGLVSGGILAWWAARAVSLLVGMSDDVFTANDPVAFIVGGIGVVLVAVFACLIPATRAIRVDPVTTLREN